MTKSSRAPRTVNFDPVAYQLELARSQLREERLTLNRQSAALRHVIEQGETIAALWVEYHAKRRGYLLQAIERHTQQIAATLERVLAGGDTDTQGKDTHR